MSTADERLRAAQSELANYQSLTQARALVAADVGAADLDVQKLKFELQCERRDVEELTHGVLGFLASLAMTAEIEREQREAMEAEVRLREAMAARDRLLLQLATLDARLKTLSAPELAKEVRIAREAKERAVIEHGGPASLQLQDLSIRIESIDIELVPLEDAVIAASSAAAGLIQILTLLDRARAAPDQGSAHVTEARGLVGDTQARITLFHRTVEPLAPPDDLTRPFSDAISAEDRQPFADGWIKKLFGPGARSPRLEEAHAAMLDRLHRIQAQLAPIRDRRDQLATRRAALVLEREHLL